MISLDPAAITAMVGIVTLLLLAAGGAYWLGKLSNRVDQLGKQVDQLSTDMREGFRELREELQEEIRRGNQQLLQALANHTHDADGLPVFRVPVSAE